MKHPKHSIWSAAVAAIFAAAMFPETTAVMYTVGDRKGDGWSPRVQNLTNYTVWVEDKHFYNGDWLYFGYDRFRYNVLEVNESGYDNCTSETFLRNWTTGAGRDVVPLNETRPYYFISGNGYCYGESAMKLAVMVENLPPPPASSPKKSGGSRFRGKVLLPAIFAVGAAWDSLLMIL